MGQRIRVGLQAFTVLILSVIACDVLVMLYDAIKREDGRQRPVENRDHARHAGDGDRLRQRAVEGDLNPSTEPAATPLIKAARS